MKRIHELQSSNLVTFFLWLSNDGRAAPPVPPYIYFTSTHTCVHSHSHEQMCIAHTQTYTRSSIPLFLDQWSSSYLVQVSQERLSFFSPGSQLQSFYLTWISFKYSSWSSFARSSCDLSTSNKNRFKSKSSHHSSELFNSTDSLLRLIGLFLASKTSTNAWPGGFFLRIIIINN